MISRFIRKTNHWPSFAVLALLSYMPFHIFLSQSLSTITGGLSAWKVAKDVFLGLAVLLTLFLVWKQKKATRVFNVLAATAFLYSVVHLFVWLLNPEIYKQTAILGTVYNTRVIWFAVLGAGAVLLAPKCITESRITKLVIAVGTIVAFLGLLQYYLPKDLLTHFGYSIERGVKPAFFIDDKPDLPRIMSTLRDPNSLGAYLIIPICLTISLFFKNQKRRMVLGGMLLIQFLTLFLTFSRGGWVGMVVAIGVLTLLQFRSWIRKHWLPILLAIVTTTVVLGIFSYIHRDQYVVQNIILHSDETTKAEEDSNELHWRLAKEGAIAIAGHPYGFGPGTAGIVSIQNPGGGVLTENYFIQIAYEVSFVGLAIFVGIWGYLIYRIQKNRGTLATTLLASAAAYAVLGLLMHIWTNESVAAQWWLLAGVVVGTKNMVTKKKSQ
jgi:hypothetical protein